MRPVVLPEVPYSATAVRPGWNDLPETVRDAISSRLGAPVTAVTGAGGGFTRAFAAVVATAAGDRVFVKAAPLTEPISDWYAREAAVTAALPNGIRAARPQWTLAEGGYFVLALDAVDARVPGLPWAAGELNAALRTWSNAASVLAAPPAELLAVGLPRLPDLIRGDLSWWTAIADGRAEMPAAPVWVPARLDELSGLEQTLPGLAGGTGMLHGDLRLDNVLIDRSGDAWLCDWTWPALGAPWFDTVTLLVSAYASGLDVDRLLEPWDAPAEGIDGALAALGGYWLVRAADGPSSASPHSRQHQRFSGQQALAWLASRRGWLLGGP